MKLKFRAVKNKASVQFTGGPQWLYKEHLIPKPLEYPLKMVTVENFIVHILCRILQKIILDPRPRHSLLFLRD
jgi:hypothetical protein